MLAVGKRGRHVPAADAWSYVAGVTAGQDISDREEQFRALRQFTMAKSFDTYAPLGPVLTTTTSSPTRTISTITCAVDGETVQSSRTGGPDLPGLRS